MTMKSNVAKTFLIVALALLVVFVGCRQEDVEEPQASQFEGIMEIDYSGWEEGNPGGELIITQVSDPKTLNRIVSEETTTSEIMDLVFDAVVERDMLTLDWAPNLVESWDIADDELSVTFTMRPDLKWSDGEPLTAEDVVFTVNEIMMKEEVEGSYRDAFFVGDELSTVELIDEDTFRLTVPQIYADIISLANFIAVPQHIFEPLIAEEGIAAVNSFWGVDADVDSIVGCGPFVIDEYLPNQRIVFAKNPYYHKEDEAGQQLPYLDKLTVLIVEDQDAELLKLQSGETDFYDMRGEDYAILIDKKEELGIEAYNVGPDLGTQFLTINQNPKSDDGKGLEDPKLAWFSNLKFRTAIAHLVDRQTIIDNVHFGFGYPQYSLVPRISPFYLESIDEEAPQFDPQKAADLLDELEMIDRDGDGFREDTDGNTISFLMETNSNNTDRVKYGEIIAQEMKKVGLDVTFRPGDFNTLVTKLVSSYDWEMIIIGLTGSVQPFLSGSNTIPSRGSLHMIDPGQESPSRDWEAELDRLYTENTTTTDFETRKETGDEIQRIWATQLPWIYTVNRALMYMFDDQLGNIKPRGFFPYRRAWGIAEYLYYK